MFKFLVPIIILVTFSACSNEFDLNAPKEETAVVYGLLDASETDHFIRVERAFLDPSISAYVVAQNPDSLYYTNAVVKIFEVNATGATIASTTLTRVNGEDYGLYRDTSGVFADSPNILYHFSNTALNVKEKSKYKLEITLPNEQVITANTTVVSKSVARTPKLGSTLKFEENSSNTYEFTEGLNTTLHTVSLALNITEQRGTAVVNVKLPWTIKKDISTGNLMLDADEFYSFLAAKLDADPTVKRFFNSIDFNVISAGAVYEEYINVVNANTGITSSGETPNYTNLSSGLGIFDSRSRLEVPGLQISPATIEVIKTHPLTKDLNFQ